MYFSTWFAWYSSDTDVIFPCLLEHLKDLSVLLPNLIGPILILFIKQHLPSAGFIHLGHLPYRLTGV